MLVFIRSALEGTSNEYPQCLFLCRNKKKKLGTLRNKNKISQPNFAVKNTISRTLIQCEVICYWSFSSFV